MTADFTTIAIAILIVIALVVAVVVLVKKNKGLKKEKQELTAILDQREDNRNLYNETLIELKEIRSKYDQLKKTINNSTGNNLSDALNGL
jgi:predicted Holliday junction resolvase-like endonuclease